MPSPDDIARLRARRDTALATAIAGESRIREFDTAIGKAERTGDRELLTRLRAQRAGVERDVAAARAEHATLRGEAFEQLVNWVEQTPEQIVNTLNDAYPFVLLPVRLETKFASGPAGAELRVRLYPDDIAISSPPPSLSEEEINLGQAYWRARSTSRHAPDNEDARRAFEGAWQTLAARSGPLRAGFVVRATTPERSRSGSRRSLVRGSFCSEYATGSAQHVARPLCRHGVQSRSDHTGAAGDCSRRWRRNSRRSRACAGSGTTGDMDHAGCVIPYRRSGSAEVDG